MIHPALEVASTEPAAPAAEFGAGTEPAPSESAASIVITAPSVSEVVEDRDNTVTEHDDEGSRRDRRAERGRSEVRGRVGR